MNHSREDILLELERRKQSGGLTAKQQFLFDVILHGPKNPNDYTRDELVMLGLGNCDLFSVSTIEYSAYDELDKEFFPMKAEDRYVKCPNCGSVHFGYIPVNSVCAECKQRSSRKNLIILAAVVIVLMYLGGCLKF